MALDRLCTGKRRLPHSAPLVTPECRASQRLSSSWKQRRASKSSMQHVLTTSTSTQYYCSDTSHTTWIQAYTHTKMLQIKLELKLALLPDASMQIDSHPICRSPALLNPRTSLKSSISPSPRHSPHPLPGMCVCARTCVFYSFHTLSHMACSFFTTTASLNLSSPQPLHLTHPPGVKPSLTREFNLYSLLYFCSDSDLFHVGCF